MRKIEDIDFSKRIEFLEFEIQKSICSQKSHEYIIQAENVFQFKNILIRDSELRKIIFEDGHLQSTVEDNKGNPLLHAELRKDEFIQCLKKYSDPIIHKIVDSIESWEYDIMIVFYKKIMSKDAVGLLN